MAARIVDFAERRCPALRILLTFCTDADGQHNIDKTLYFIQHLCRALSSCQRFCEFLYIGGPPNTGKDVMASLMQQMFGDVNTNGWAVTTVPKDHFICSSARAQAKGSNTAIEASMAPGRLVLIPEVKKGTLAMDELKDRVEQGAPPPSADGPWVTLLPNLGV